LGNLTRGKSAVPRQPTVPTHSGRSRTTAIGKSK